MTAAVVSTRRWRPLLVASLALNLLFIAAVGAHYVRTTARSSTERWKANIDILAKSLPESDAAKFRATLAQRLPALEAARGDLRTAREAIADIIRTEPFDRAALERAMADFGTKRVGLQATYQAMLADAAAAMSHDGRIKLADWSSRRR